MTERGEHVPLPESCQDRHIFDALTEHARLIIPPEHATNTAFGSLPELTAGFVMHGFNGVVENQTLLDYVRDRGGHYPGAFIRDRTFPVLAAYGTQMLWQSRQRTAYLSTSEKNRRTHLLLSCEYDSDMEKIFDLYDNDETLDAETVLLAIGHSLGIAFGREPLINKRVLVDFLQARQGVPPFIAREWLAMLVDTKALPPIDRHRKYSAWSAAELQKYPPRFMPAPCTDIDRLALTQGERVALKKMFTAPCPDAFLHHIWYNYANTRTRWSGAPIL